MSKFLFSEFDPISGTTKEYRYQDDKLVETTKQDISANLKMTAAMRNDDDYSRQGIKNGYWHVAHIPDSVIVKWLTEEGFDAMKAPVKEVLKRLERPEYKYLKTTNGRIA